MTIARRLIFLLAFSPVMLIAVSLFSRFQLAKIEDRTRFVAESRIAALATVGNLSRSFAEMRVNVRSYLLASTPQQREAARLSFDQREADVTRLLEHYADHIVFSNQGRRLLGQYQTFSREWIVKAREVLTLADAGRRDEAVALLNGRVNEVGEELSEVSSEWIRNNEELSSSAGQEALTTIEKARWQILTGEIAALVLSGVFGFLTVRQIVRPIRALERSVKSVAAGHYASKVPFTDGTDEIGQLARSIDVLK